MDNKEKYVRQGVLNLTHSTGIALLLLAPFVHVSLSALDYFVTPENFVRFLIYRTVAASLTIALYFFFSLKNEIRYKLTIIVLGTLVTAIYIELMILSF